MRKFFTSESVTEGHPDKLCDYISDSVLDAYLEKDETSRVALETVASKEEVYLTGEITSNANVDIEAIVRNAIKEVGYDSEEAGMDYKTCSIRINISKQSSDIAMGVDNALETREKNGETLEGAGDQGIMFGFACDETEEFMPLAIMLAHKLAKRLEVVRKEKIIDGLRPDGKVQVTVEYEDDKPVRVDTIVVSAQHIPEKDIDELRKEIIEKVIKEIVPAKLLDSNTKYLVNPTGRFVIGGPYGDSGLTGRKIIVDTYGGYARNGGGAFSGKDATKVDRSASYMARYIAKNIVASGIASRCQIQLSYAIGVAEPTSILVDTFGTAKVSESLIEDTIRKNFKLTPKGIIDTLDLKRPIYAQTAAYGHFGRNDIDLPWEHLDKVDVFKNLLK